MNIVTIFDYSLEDINNKIMLQMFVGGIIENCKKYPYTLWIITNQSNNLDQLFTYSFIRTLKIKENRNIKKTIQPNIKNKLYNLCNLDFEFIYLDCDMYISSDLSFIWDKRKDKPFISTIHQRNVKGIVCKNHTGTIDFMNSGFQVISDPAFLNYETLYSFGESLNFKFDVPGSDQALLDAYCKKINYDFLHKDIGCEWNSCAGHGVVNIDNDYKFNITYKNDAEEYPVKINHYWHEFKPWLINCPIFNFYKEIT